MPRGVYHCGATQPASLVHAYLEECICQTLTPMTGRSLAEWHQPAKNDGLQKLSNIIIITRLSCQCL